MTLYPALHSLCPFCGRPHAAHTITDHLNCFAALRQRNQAARAVEFERQHPRPATESETRGHG